MDRVAAILLVPSGLLVAFAGARNLVSMLRMREFVRNYTILGPLPYIQLWAGDYRGGVGGLILFGALAAFVFRHLLPTVETISGIDWFREWIGRIGGVCWQSMLYPHVATTSALRDCYSP